MHASVTAWARRPPVWGITILGVVLTMGGIAAIPYHVRGEPLVRVLFYVFMDLCLPLGVLTSAALVARTDLEARDVTVVTRWTLATVTIVAGLYLWSRLDDVLRGAGTRSIVADLALFSSFGAAFGLTIGVNRARAAQNTRLLERTAAQQDALAFINHLLRHNVLNGLQVLNGYGDLLGEHTDETGARYLATIQERTDHMADLVGTVRVLMRTLAEGVEPAPVDCSRVVEREVSIARRGHPEAVVETDIDDDLVVQADATLGSVLENLLTNAVVHSDAAVPHVSVSASREGDEVVVRIADDGPGIPADLREHYLGEGVRGPDSAGTGFGLYLASTLVEAYGGRFHLGDNDPTGALVELRLRAADSGTRPVAETLH